ncbi:hypothetical protein GUJ93_ZPchr0001g31966 [Zizania palustris]|uniref:Bifunctional inhibitor/plant lipid transfer protein/seed storage helical domain-containing protein n=1 Tax=Zizania palustris TaxID=103762 RepID=A0A8J5RBD4_ZIZPA|nr:hypothetical protein GUJ93_ZPchr0001g31966 [Zizania palustris]
MNPCTVLVLVLVAVVTSPGSALCRASRTAPARCDLLALRPCAPVIWREAPSPACCAELRNQERCLCEYAKNPDLRKYINSQNSKWVAAACSMQVPSC